MALHTAVQVRTVFVNSFSELISPYPLSFLQAMNTQIRLSLTCSMWREHMQVFAGQTSRWRGDWVSNISDATEWDAECTSTNKHSWSATGSTRIPSLSGVKAETSLQWWSHTSDEMRWRLSIKLDGYGKVFPRVPCETCSHGKYPAFVHHFRALARCHYLLSCYRRFSRELIRYCIYLPHLDHRFPIDCSWRRPALARRILRATDSQD
jgi:hypothetical protein